MKKGKTLCEVFERENLVKAITEPLTGELVSQYLASIGRKGGKAKGGAKSAAAIANGKLGGRPKKPKRTARRQNDVSATPVRI